MYKQALTTGGKIFAVAPMIDWTDTRCRFLHRQLSHHALLYTEMIVADAIIHGLRDKLLGYHPQEHPVALQLGGSDPAKLSEAVKIASDYGYDEINLNVGCPSDRVQSGTFGACLMREPETVARCVAAMKAVATVPVTVKCRIGVDDQEPETVLPDFIARVVAAGADAVWIHARKAWLQGLSPKENRDVPPLDYALVYRMKQENPGVFIGINGGITDLEQAEEHLKHMDGVMLGRAAYHNTCILADVDHRVYGEAATAPDWMRLRDTMMDYAQDYIDKGGRLNHVTRHMVGLFQGLPGARRFRQILSSDATRPGAGPEVIAAAFAAINFDTSPESIAV
ncbi:tRNA dihydrouridine(20/20a) synthase DusA [Agrobacterium rubi]|uniref:tRNA-dihydrouridine(20/20a) synthase n=1 Tax=Agrobacterium rubi TaxID=28099 RepID=A0AAE7R7Z6_9HYPH|nr:tRNA dihydrouridine(20/20a) synthase DusA [Agrobacterium rubi]NTE86325.1 tRNA dihydrouridine(20/20a) synthase DusA [Agrobacterium rubi]NTF02257.1 tRNA dihydrouridine(20/20a) synthase DusA [Agrobacterium rubi]NTF36501.1 tRNA dihydrouridine(20/20a) synthase DusA [Agrobacterium rubi]OCJ44245.1 tRNA dihydrouridine synthase DusA [Agrobacterium rubi]QTF98968.1 tRNA dihydrouridine(20/20a) synthase DusA [Agrobacterium rubi]